MKVDNRQKNKKILIGMPAFNEGRVIFKVVKSIIDSGFGNVLVVDDCSLDNTGIQAKKAGAKVLRHVINRGGPGAPTSTIIEYAKREGYDYLVLIDSDGQHSAKDINVLLKFADKFDVVIGSRMVGDISKMPLQRKIANFVGSFVTWFFFGLFVWDSQSGFKVFNRRAIEKVNISFDTFEFCSEIIGEINKNKLSYKEVPIDVIYSSHSLGKVHGQSIKNGFKMILRFLFRM